MIEPLREASADGPTASCSWSRASSRPPPRRSSASSARGKTGFSVLERDDLERFAPIEGVELPHGPAYLLTASDTGAET